MRSAMTANPSPAPKHHEYATRSARECHFALQEWAKDARLYSEAIFRLAKQVSESTEPFAISDAAWNLGTPDKYQFQRGELQKRLKQLPQKSWQSQFVLLESIWEIYLEMLYVELSEVFPEALEDLCKQSPPDFLLQSLFVSRPLSLDELRTRTAEWLASNLTRKSWPEQWAELQRLRIGLTEKHKKEPWWQKLEIYFEMRNCLVHRSGRPSEQLRIKDPAIQNQLDNDGNILLTPRQLQFFWIQFQNVITAIDKSLVGRLAAQQRTSQ